MRLDYRTLWIDDQPRHVQSFKEGIERRLTDLGFELRVQEVSSLDDVDAAVGASVHDDGIDLVLVDYDLGNEGGGEEALEKIRKQCPFKDIIFYSAGDRDNLRRLAYEKKIDGVYFSTRLSLVDDAIAVIENTLHKIMDVDHMRGVVLAATSDIDSLVERSLGALYEKLPPERQATFRAEIFERMRSKLKSWEVEVGKAEKKNTLAAILKLHYVFSASERLEFFIAVLSEVAPEAGSRLELANEYVKEVVPRRNDLAHGSSVEQDGKRVFVGRKGPVTQSDMTVLRKDLVRHRGNFVDIAVLIDVPLS